MKKLLFLLVLFSFLFLFSLYAKDFKVASYNVENLFDLHYDGTEYKEYIPNTKTWDKRSFHNKIKNISQTINHLNADIVALQEIESKLALDKLLQSLSKYKYSKFIKNKTSSVGLAILSRYPIKRFKRVIIDKNDKYSRDILRVTITIENKDLMLYVNHWRSKRAEESKRIPYAIALKRDIDTLDKNTDYIILGDLNSNYDEYQSFKYNKKLNDTYGITGINQVLNTTIRANFVLKNKIANYDELVHYNLWLDLDIKNRFSSRYRGENDTPDNIIISEGLFDNKNISYVDKSFKVFKPAYLYKNKINRWNMYRKNGYSDHLPIYAMFSTNIQKYDFAYISKDKTEKNNTIKSLYNLQNVTNYPINNIIVIYKNKNIAIVKNEKGRSIMIYKPSNNLKLGYKYNIIVDEIDLYNGLKEIKKFSSKKELSYYEKYKNLYLDGRQIDLFDLKYQNEIIKNLRGKYKKGYLYFKNSNKKGKIKLYFYSKLKRPKDGDIITITSGHLGIYKSKVQIILYKESDFN